MNNTDAAADDQGSKWSLTALRKRFKKMGVDDSKVFKKIEDIIIKTFISGENVINNATEMFCPFWNNCFELLGFDILIDNCYEPWLLEVNLSPSLGCDSPLDQKIKANLIADTLTLAGIVPIDQRNSTDQGGKKQGIHYGAYTDKNGHGLDSLSMLMSHRNVSNKKKPVTGQYDKAYKKSNVIAHSQIG